jgi:hypothetical protein
MLCTSAALTGASRWLDIHYQLIAMGVLLIAAIALSAYLLLGPEFKYPKTITGIALVLLSVQLFLLTDTVAVGLTYAADTSYVLQVIVFALCGLTALLCIGVTWFTYSAFAEPIAIGIASLALGALCLPGVTRFTRTISYPSVSNGQATLYSDAQAGYPLSLAVSYQNSFNNTAQTEGFTISNSSRQDVRWALTVDGPARLTNVELFNPNIRYHRISFTPYATEQVFTGTVGPETFESITGHTSASFASYTSDAAAVALPGYGGGYGGMLIGHERNFVVGFLHHIPALSSISNMVTTVTAGPRLPFESLTDSYPAPVASSNPSAYEWESKGLPIDVRYAVTLENAANSTTSALFTFSVLLGVAGAGVLASLQGIIRVFARRESDE